MTKTTVWTTQMDGYLRRNYHHKTAADIAKKLCVSKPALLRRARKLNIDSKQSAGTALSRHYTSDEIAYIRENFEALGIDEIAVRLHRSPEGVRRKANKIGLKTASTVRQFTDEEAQILKANINFKTYREIGLLINRGEEETRWHARRLKLTGTNRKDIKTLPPSQTEDEFDSSD